MAKSGRCASMSEADRIQNRAAVARLCDSPASTLPLFVGDVAALPRACLAVHSSARCPQRPLCLLSLRIDD